MATTWDDLNRRLLGAALALDLHDSLTVGDRVASPRRTWFGGRKAPSQPRRFVQITAAQTVLIAECVGATSFGGDWPMTPEQEATLLRQGWDKPWPDPTTAVRTWQREAPLLGAPKLVLATVRALELLGCDPDDLQFDLTREEPD